MGIRSFGQQGIVFAVFAALFAVFAIGLPGFFTTANMLTLLQNVAVLGILGLAMAIVVIGRGIDISLIAALGVPPGLVRCSSSTSCSGARGSTVSSASDRAIYWASRCRS
jgi:ribose transport system permease protein